MNAEHNKPSPKNKRYLHMASATEEAIDAWLDSFFDPDYVPPLDRIRSVLMAGSTIPPKIKRSWYREATTHGKEGVVGIVKVEPDNWLAVINVPIIPTHKDGDQLTEGDLPRFLGQIPTVPPSAVSIQEDFLHYQHCYPIDRLDETDEDKIQLAFIRLQNGLQTVKNEMIIAFHRFFEYPQEEIEAIILVSVMPEVLLPDQDLQIVYRLLTLADQKVRDRAIFMMETWDAMGYLVRTTPRSIVLDAPYGEHGDHLRLAVILPGLSWKVVATLGGADEDYQPAIILPWTQLIKGGGLTPEALADYQAAVEELVEVRLTSASAHIQQVFSLTREQIGGVLAAMDALVKSIDHRAVQPRQKSEPITPKNIQKTLDNCSPLARAHFERLIGAWRTSEGTVQSVKPGRIYLKMKTGAHSEGEVARTPRRFNLLTLVCRERGAPAFVQVAWGLADGERPSAYLDSIPEEVAAFEAVVSALPGFEQAGTVTRLMLDESVTPGHIDELVWAVMRLMSAEKMAR